MSKVIIQNNVIARIILRDAPGLRVHLTDKPGPAGPAGPPGAPGTPGTPGANGVGVPVGGTTGQILAKATNTDYDTEWVDDSGGISGMAPVGAVPNADGATILGSTLTLQPAAATFPGVVTATAQEISGQKTFLDEVLKAVGGSLIFSRKSMGGGAFEPSLSVDAAVFGDYNAIAVDTGLDLFGITQVLSTLHINQAQGVKFASWPDTVDRPPLAQGPHLRWNTDLNRFETGITATGWKSLAWTTDVPAGTIPAGGTTNQALTKINATDYNAQWSTIDKTWVGLSNVDNTSDVNKPVSTAQAAAIALKENVITATTSADYYRGDKTFQPLNKAAVGLGNVDNTSDANKPVSTAQQTAINDQGVPTGGVGGQMLMKVDATDFNDTWGNEQLDYLHALQALGSALKGQVIGLNPWGAGAGSVLTSNVGHGAAVWVPKAGTLTGAAFICSGVGNFTGSNYNGIALYTWAAGVLTKVAETANDPNIWKKALGTLVKEPFVTPYVATRGIYFLVGIYSSSAVVAGPTVARAGGGFNACSTMDMSNSTKLAFTITGATSALSSITLSSATLATTCDWMAVY